MGKIESAVAWAIEIANDPRCGYSQSSRWGPPDFDCSSFVISAWEQAGVPLREAGASFTGNMRAAMIMCGFVDVTNLVGIDTGYGNATFKITEDGKAESAALTVFRAKDFENAKFTNAEAFKNGDTVVVIGQLQRYVKDGNMTPELSKGWMIAIIPAAAE